MRVCYRPPVCGVCPNYEVVEFQNFTVTPPEYRLCPLVLRIYYCPTSPSLPAIQCTSRVGIPLLPRHPLHQRLPCFCTGSSVHLGVTCLRPSIPMFPDSPLSFAVRDPPLQPPLAPVTPVVFLLPPYPCPCKNSFYRDLRLLLCCCLPPPWHPEYPPSLITRISRTNVNYRP